MSIRNSRVLVLTIGILIGIFAATLYNWMQNDQQIIYHEVYFMKLEITTPAPIELEWQTTRENCEKLEKISFFSCTRKLYPSLQ